MTFREDIRVIKVHDRMTICEMNICISKKIGTSDFFVLHNCRFVSEGTIFSNQIFPNSQITINQRLVGGSPENCLFFYKNNVLSGIRKIEKTLETTLKTRNISEQIQGVVELAKYIQEMSEDILKNSHEEFHTKNTIWDKSKKKSIDELYPTISLQKKPKMIEPHKCECTSASCLNSHCTLHCSSEECGSACNMGSRCQNNHLRLHKSIDICVKEAPKKGLGVFSRHDIVSVAFIEEYVGVAIKKEKRKNYFKDIKMTRSYIF